MFGPELVNDVKMYEMANKVYIPTSSIKIQEKEDQLWELKLFDPKLEFMVGWEREWIFHNYIPRARAALTVDSTVLPAATAGSRRLS
jgi:hypothetical protein